MDSYSLYYFVTGNPIPGVLLDKFLELFRSIDLEARRGIQITRTTQTVYNHQTMNGMSIELETKKQALRPFRLWAGRHWGSHSTWLALLNLMFLHSRWGKQCFLSHTHRTESQINMFTKVNHRYFAAAVIVWILQFVKANSLNSEWGRNVGASRKTQISK